MGFLDNLDHLMAHKLHENIQILELCENIQIFGCSHKVMFLAFLAFTVALKVNYVFEI